MKNNLKIDFLQKFLPERLSSSLPGLAAQLKLSPLPPPSSLTWLEARERCLKAAVLILIYPRDSQPHIVFILRTGLGNHHQNQISFPGGGLKEGESFVEAALREAREEIGLEEKQLKIAGLLTPLYVERSNYCIHPVVAITSREINFQPCQLEVAEIIEVPLSHLLDRKNLKQEYWSLRGQKYLVPFYEFGQHKIWGATAMILSELLEIISKMEDFTEKM
ncbi:MAG: CoA pyrophosphatase [Candidatus Saccharicenans sp.]